MSNIDKLVQTSSEEYDEKFKEVTELLYKLQHMKGKSYGGSWCRRGHIGVFHNVMRKTDRLENMNAMDPSVWENIERVSGESVIDTIADTATYCIKWLTGYMVTHPEKFEELENYVKTLEEGSSIG